MHSAYEKREVWYMIEAKKLEVREWSQEKDKELKEGGKRKRGKGM